MHQDKNIQKYSLSTEKLVDVRNANQTIPMVSSNNGILPPCRWAGALPQQLSKLFIKLRCYFRRLEALRPNKDISTVQYSTVQYRIV